MSNMVINTNVLAINSHRALKGVGSNIARSSERLSSGLRINRAADDAAGLAISEKMRSQIRGLNQASTNSLDGISLIQTAEGALQETHNMLQRMRQLTLQAQNDVLELEDRNKIALELNQLSTEINETAAKTEFNRRNLIDGSMSAASIPGGVWLQTGANQNQGISFNISAMTATVLGVTQTAIGQIVAVATTGNSTAMQGVLGAIDAAIASVSLQRATLGALQNRLEHTIRNLDVSAENLAAAESRIRDTDMAKEMMTLTQNNVLSQAAISMLAQANQGPQSLLQLLR